MGRVFRARHEYLKKDVALKILARDLTENESFKKRFEREARILARLDHPHVVKVFDAGRAEDGSYYIAMELLEGGTLLAAARKSKRLRPSQVAEFMFQTAEALDAAHRLGILHRDVKPENILLTPGGAKLADFNLAAMDETLLEDSPSAIGGHQSEVSSVGRMVGTPPYVAPERANDQKGDHRSDIYSLGATFYALAAGGYLFEGIGTAPDSHMEWRWHQVKVEPKPLTVRVPGFPEPLAKIIHTCLAKDPIKRFQSYKELLADFVKVRKLVPEGPTRHRIPTLLAKGTVVRGDSVSSETPTPASSVPAASPRRRTRRITLAATGLALAAVIGVGVAYRKTQAPESGHPHEPAGNQRVPESKKQPDEEREVRQPPDKETLPNDGSKEKPADPPKGDDPKKDVDVLALAERLRTYEPTPEEQKCLEDFLNVATTHHGLLTDRSYAGADEALSQLAKDPRQTEYTRSMITEARRMIVLAASAVSGRHGELREIGAAVSVRLKDGTMRSGKLESFDERSVTLAESGGQTTRIQLSELSTEDYLPQGTQSRLAISFRALSGSAAPSVSTVLSSLSTSEDLAWWIPLMVRLAHEDAKALARGERFKEASDSLDLLLEKRGNIEGLFSFLKVELDQVGKELTGLRLFEDGKFTDVLVSCPDTWVAPVAARRFLGEFEKSLTGDLVETSEWWNWTLDPDPKDEKDRARYYDLDRESEAIRLSDPAGLRKIVMKAPRPGALKGLVVGYRLSPEPAVDGACFRISLSSQKGTVHLKLDLKTVTLVRPTFGKETGGEVLATGPNIVSADPKGWNALAIVPSGVHLLVFAGEKLAFTVPKAEARIPEQLSLAVYGARLLLKHVKVPKE